MYTIEGSRRDVCCFTSRLGGYRHYAVEMAERLSVLNNVTVKVFEEGDLVRYDAAFVKSCMYKFMLFDHTSAERAIWIDADMAACRPMPLSALPLGDYDIFLARDGKRTVDAVLAQTRALGIELPRYFNSGFFIASRTCEPLFAYYREHYKALLSRVDFNMAEQTAFNVLLHEHKVRIGELSNAWNWMPSVQDEAADPVIHVHFAGCCEALAERIDLMQNFVAELQGKPAKRFIEYYAGPSGA